MANISSINSIDSLLHSSWATLTNKPVSLTYSFMTAITPESGKYAVGFAAMTDVQREGVKAAMATWSAVANITFTEVASGGDIQLGTNDQGDDSAAYATYPDIAGSYLLTNNTGAYNFKFAAGGYGLATLVHELGHTLGLKHPGDYRDDGTAAHEGPYLPAAYDNNDYSIMSYNRGNGFDVHRKYASTPMALDIQAMQYLYGANMAYHAGDDAYKYVNGTAPLCIWDAGGADTLDFSLCTGRTVIDLREGSFSSTTPGFYNVSLALNVTIENAIAGSGGSSIFGNDAGNVMTGGAGTDFIHLGKGSDTVNGGGGGRDQAIFDLDLANYSFGGSKAVLTVTGEGTDVLTNISSLAFSDRTIELSTYVSLGGGGAGQDRFVAATGNELFSGGGGLDTVQYGGVRDNYTVTASGNDFIVSDKSGSGGADLVAGVERLEFSDGKGVAFDIDGAAGQTFRMYQAAFNRTPDLGGVGYWLDKMDDGLPLVRMAQFFLDSAESTATYGPLTDAQFVHQMYANVLHREPDAGGQAFHLNNLTAGVPRAVVLVDFSESLENQIGVIGSITNGINYTAS